MIERGAMYHCVCNLCKIIKRFHDVVNISRKRNIRLIKYLLNLMTFVNTVIKVVAQSGNVIIISKGKIVTF